MKMGRGLRFKIWALGDVVLVTVGHNEGPTRVEATSHVIGTVSF